MPFVAVALVAAWFARGEIKSFVDNIDYNLNRHFQSSVYERDIEDAGIKLGRGLNPDKVYMGTYELSHADYHGKDCRNKNGVFVPFPPPGLLSSSIEDKLHEMAGEDSILTKAEYELAYNSTPICE